MSCDHEEQRLARKLKTETIDRFDVDSVGGHYEVCWCEKCGAIKRGQDPWQLPTDGRRDVVLAASPQAAARLSEGLEQVRQGDMLSADESMELIFESDRRVVGSGP